jgi:UDP-N-acetylmuramate--alanine ligase
MQPIDFKNIKKVHFIGIGGIGISAIARMFLLEGKIVTGSDRAASEVTEALEKAGIKIFLEQRPENIHPQTDLIIYTVAIPADNPELKAAQKAGIPCITYPQALGIVSKDKFTIAVSGAHGKTTTTAMIAKMLMDAGLDPTVVVGSLMKNETTGAWSNFVAGKGKYLVAEACEYRRSFLNLSPKILVITNIDDDHLDYYKDIEDIKSAFKEMVEKIPADGYLVCDMELPHIEEVAKQAKCTVMDYEVFGNQNLRLKVPGAHNISNAAAALAVADILGIKRKNAEKSLENFSGTWRRFEHKGTTKTGVEIYDDYGHHPTEVKATLAGAREFFGDKKITVIFQPHLFSRTKQHLEEFGKAFKDANEVILAPIYPARELFDPSISSDMVAEKILATGIPAQVFITPADIKNYISTTSASGDVVITMGAGDIYKTGEALL